MQVQNLPERLRDHQAIVRHQGNYTFVLKDKVDKKNARAVIQIDFKKKGKVTNSIRSLGTVDLTTIKKDYELLEGEL